jgi:hypothetical protein
MKKQIVFPLLMACFMTTAGFAQSPTTAPAAKDKSQKAPMSAEDKAAKEANKAEKELGLSAEQKSKWQAAALTRITANKPLIEKMQGSTTPEERRQLKSQIRTNGQSFDTTVNGMLSPEQQAKWQTWKGNKKKEMNKKMKEKKWSEDEFED